MPWASKGFVNCFCWTIFWLHPKDLCYKKLLQQFQRRVQLWFWACPSRGSAVPSSRALQKRHHEPQGNNESWLCLLDVRPDRQHSRGHIFGRDQAETRMAFDGEVNLCCRPVQQMPQAVCKASAGIWEKLRLRTIISFYVSERSKCRSWNEWFVWSKWIWKLLIS